MHRGDRVKLGVHPGALEFNDEFGEVISIGRLWIYVRGERSGRTMMFKKTKPPEVCNG